MKKENSFDAFHTMPVSVAVMKNAIPAMAAMLMVLVYNLTDTFFIGQTHNEPQDDRDSDRAGTALWDVIKHCHVVDKLSI